MDGQNYSGVKDRPKVVNVGCEGPIVGGDEEDWTST